MVLHPQTGRDEGLNIRLLFCLLPAILSYVRSIKFFIRAYNFIYIALLMPD